MSGATHWDAIIIGSGPGRPPPHSPASLDARPVSGAAR